MKIGNRGNVSDLANAVIKAAFASCSELPTTAMVYISPNTSSINDYRDFCGVANTHTGQFAVYCQLFSKKEDWCGGRITISPFKDQKSKLQFECDLTQDGVIIKALPAQEPAAA